MLQDADREIRQQAQKTLAHFLRRLESASKDDITLTAAHVSALMSVLLKFANTGGWGFAGGGAGGGTGLHEPPSRHTGEGNGGRGRAGAGGAGRWSGGGGGGGSGAGDVAVNDVGVVQAWKWMEALLRVAPASILKIQCPSIFTI